MISHPSCHLGQNSYSILHLQHISSPLSVLTQHPNNQLILFIFFSKSRVQPFPFLSIIITTSGFVLDYSNRLLAPCLHHPLPATVNIQSRSLVMLKYMLDRITLLSQHYWTVLCLAVMELWELDLLHHKQGKKNSIKKVVFKYWKVGSL